MADFEALKLPKCSVGFKTLLGGGGKITLKTNKTNAVSAS